MTNKKTKSEEQPHKGSEQKVVKSNGAKQTVNEKNSHASGPPAETPKPPISVGPASRRNSGAVADYFDEQVDRGRAPEEFGRIWVHTHPGASPEPSVTDEETFARVFGKCDWAVMAILAQGGAPYARLHFGVGPGGSLEIPVEVDYGAAFPGSDRAVWEAEYATHVLPAAPPDAPWDPEDRVGLVDDPWEARDESEYLMAEEAGYADF